MFKLVLQMGKQVSRLTTIWVDGGNECEPFMQWVMDVCRCPTTEEIEQTAEIISSAVTLTRKAMFT